MGPRITSLACGVLLAVASAAALMIDVFWRENLSVEAAACRFGLCANDLVLAAAHEKLWEGKQAAAISLFTGSVRRDPLSSYRWADLGEAHLRAGNLAEAEYCFGQARKLGPHLPAIALRAAQFEALRGEPEAALAQLSLALSTTRIYDEVVFALFEGMGIPPEKILGRGVPPRAQAAAAYFRHLLAQGERKALDEAWRWMRRHGIAGAAEARRYSRHLYQRGEYAQGWRIWADWREPQRSSLLLNGGFEQDFLDAPFGWRFSRAAQAHAVRDSGHAHRGGWSLRIDFEEPFTEGFQHVRQQVPGVATTLRFRGWVRAGSRDAGGFQFQVADGEARGRILWESPTITLTADWTLVEGVIHIPDRVRLIELRLHRQMIPHSGSLRRRASVWVDSISLSLVGQTQARSRGEHTAEKDCLIKSGPPSVGGPCVVVGGDPARTPAGGLIGIDGPWSQGGQS